MFYEKYEPKSLGEIIGNKMQILDAVSWLKNPKKPLIVSGPTGSGKTLLIKLIAKEANFEILEADDLDDLVSASKARSIFHRGKLIVLEIGQVRDMRGVTELAKSARHLIIVTNDVYDRRLSNLRRACKVVKMEKLNTNDIYRYLKAIVQKEKINFVDSSLMQIARNCNGDIRAALIDLEAQSSGERVIERGIFEVLKSLSSSDLKGSREILSNTDMNQIFIWIEENIADSGSIEDIASSYEFLAKADMFRARIIRREAWTLQKYYASMLSASFSKTKSTLYKFPTFYRKSNDDALLEKIGSKLHVSKREAASYIGIIKQLYKKDKSIASSFRFDEEDLEKLK